ncbi:MAG: mycothione reductase [Jatrophihabitantaceae bacterium]
MPHYDLAIIGSGSGNSIVGPEFDDWQIAIVEESTFGGTCLNVGCIPTKMFVYPADLAEFARHSTRLGVDAAVTGVRWADIRDRVFGRIDPISAGGREYRAHGEPNTTLYEAHASFTGPRELALSTGEVITADRIVLATGSHANIPDVIAESGVPFHTSDTVMRIDDVPRRVAILGGGYIAAEFAHVFSAFGAQTTVICRSAPLLRHLDLEVATRFTELVKERWDVRLDTVVTAAESVGDAVRLALTDGSTVEADLLLVATGRDPNSDRMNLGAAGVDLHPDGRIVADAFQRTSAEGIWTLGDVSSEHQLKHVANHESRVVAHNLAHPDAMIESDHRFVPEAVFTHPQLAFVGLTEDEAVAADRPFVTSVQDYGGTAYGWAMEDTSGVCKLIADPLSGTLLGAHLMGEQASTLIQPLIQAMSFGLGVREMARGQYWIHPALTEVVENALLRLDL